MRRGFTTGTAAAAATRAAAIMLFWHEKRREVFVDTPAGIKVRVKVREVRRVGEREAVASVIKDAGDDPDVTDGCRIVAHLCRKGEGVEIRGGEGVGRVTQPGLAVPVGEDAINPVPRSMIRGQAEEIMPPDSGVDVEISVPRGRQLAEKTMNPRLGIVGGISILGTTGIVEPMSRRAYRESLALAVRQAVAMGEKRLVLVFGNYGRKQADRMGYRGERVVKMGNYVGYMVDTCKEEGVEEIFLLGHPGKLVKVAAGIFNTHSRVADARAEVVAAHAAALGANSEQVARILNVGSTVEMLAVAEGADLKGLYRRLARRVVERVEERTGGELETGACFFTPDRGVLGGYPAACYTGETPRSKEDGGEM